MNLLPNQRSYLWLFCLKLLPLLTRSGWARGSRCVVPMHGSHNSSEEEEHCGVSLHGLQSGFSNVSAAHTAEGQRSQALIAASDLRHRCQMLRPKRGELSRDNEPKRKSRFERWCKVQEIVQRTVVEISHPTGTRQIPFYISWLEQANLKRISMALRKQSWTKSKPWKIMVKRKSVGNEVETSTQEEKKDSQTRQN